MEVTINGRKHPRLPFLVGSCPIKGISLKGINQYLRFFKEILRRKDLGLELLVGCGQLCLSSNQIAGFCDHQYLLEEPIDTLDFLHGANHQGKIGFETTSLVG